MGNFSNKVPAGILCLFFFGWLGLYFDGTPSPKPADAEPGDYSAHRALTHLKIIAKKPRPLGSQAHREVSQYLVKQLKAMGLEVELQKAKTASLITQDYHQMPPTNIVARLKGSNSKHTILLSAHYETVEHSWGAGDNGAAVATILETLRALKTGPGLANDLVILFVDS